jgi:hypothetical protein
MKVITYFEENDFLSMILAKIDKVEVGNYENYQHTHDRVHYNPETGHIQFEEVCINEYGSCFGRGIGGEAHIPIEWNSLLPKQLLESPNWMDL